MLFFVNKFAPVIDVNYFTRQSPLKELGSYAHDGKTIYFYKHNGLFLSIHLDMDNDYGKYYQLSVSVENLTGRSVLVDPKNIVAVGTRRAKPVSLDILPYDQLSCPKKALQLI